MRLYLDIDGVILGKGGKIPEDVLPFLQFVTAHFDCHWLTTHCKGDAQTAVRYLARHYPVEWLGLLDQIQPTNWDALKTEGIDFGVPFVWLDDQPFEAERRVLAQQGCADCLVVVDLGNAGELQRIIILLGHK